MKIDSPGVVAPLVSLGGGGPELSGRDLGQRFDPYWNRKGPAKLRGLFLLGILPYSN